MKAVGQHGGKCTLYYDADCGFCSRTVRYLARLDFMNTTRWTPFQSLEEPLPGLSWEDFNHAAYLHDPRSGRLFAGFYAFRRLPLKMAALMPLAPLFWFPGIALLGTPVYAWIARNRYHIAHCEVPSTSPTESRGPGHDRS